MSESGHTPGKWTKRGDRYVNVIINGRDVLLASVDGMNIPLEEVAANARLIASAPELLAACQAVLTAIENVSFDRYASAALEPSYKQILAAVAKATGETGATDSRPPSQD